MRLTLETLRRIHERTCPICKQEKQMVDEVKHKGLPVAGYKPQNQWAVDTVNTHKQMEEQILALMDSHKLNENVDQRWLAIARTDLEKAFMALNRAIFKPERIKL